MAQCSYCGTSILFGGTRYENTRYCNQNCLNNGLLLSISNKVPSHTIQEQMQSIHQGFCPKCKGKGPIDVHTSYEVWSALLLTSWKSKPGLSCRSCGRKAQLASAALSLVAGWWGFPWGLIMTPVQVVRNFAAMAGGPDDLRPSPMLEKIVRLMIASQIVEESKRNTPPPLPKD